MIKNLEDIFNEGYCDCDSCDYYQSGELDPICTHGYKVDDVMKLSKILVSEFETCPLGVNMPIDKEFINHIDNNQFISRYSGYIHNCIETETINTVMDYFDFVKHNL